MRPQRLRKEMVGVVVSDRMTKTVMVEARRHVVHERYKKVQLRRNKFAAHDEKEIAGIGDVVRIRESRPLSRTKRWRVVEVLRAAPGASSLLTDPEERDATKGRRK